MVRLTRPVQLVLAALAGAIGSLAQAPTGFAPAMLFMCVVGFFLFARAETARAAAWTGACLATAYFALTLRWIVEPFLVDVASHGWMAPFALALLAGGLSLIWAGAFALAHWLGAGRYGALIVTWTGAELLRAYAFTGFPWANPAQGLLESPVAAYLALLGPHGLTLALMVVAGNLVDMKNRALALGLLGLFLAVLALPPRYGPPDLTEHTIRIVQPNAPQDEKWHPDHAAKFVQRQVDYTQSPGAPNLVVWPEMAIPYRASVAAPVFETAAISARGAPVLMGAMRDDPEGRFFNAALLIGSQGQILQHYDKRHLVPFGEYMPFPALFRSLGIQALAERTETGYTPGGPNHTLDLGPLGPALVLICYEAVFPQDLRGTERPNLLIQITNDAWFGKASGPQQHLALARMRAIEQGLPLVRSANTGISAMISPAGEVLQSLPLGEAGFLDAPLPSPRAPTLYSRTGDLPYVLLLSLLLAFLTFRRLRH